MMMNTDSIIVRQFFLEHYHEAAGELEKFEPNELSSFFDDAPVDLLQAVIPVMNPQVLLHVFELMKQENVFRLFESMEFGKAEYLIRMMNESQAEEILNKLPSEKSLHIRRMLKYLKNAVGTYVEQKVFTLTENLTVKEAWAQARRYKSNIEPNLFVIAPDRKLKGMVNLSDLIKEKPEKDISSIMKSKFATIPPETPIESILGHPGWMEQYVLPVVDESKVFLGVIRLETIRSIQIDSDPHTVDPGLNAINALGDLYQIGLAGLLRVATDFKSGSDKET